MLYCARSVAYCFQVVLTALADVRQTQRWQSTAVLRQLSGSAETGVVEMPEAMSFPVRTFDDIDMVEEKLAASATQKLLVRYASII